MSLWQLAARNLWRSRRRYLAYVASAATAVMIYFLHSALIYHPDVQGGVPDSAAAFVARGLKAANVVIAVFSFGSLLVANAAFVHSRVKEFGLLSLMGLSRTQLLTLILVEGLLIGGVALAGGLAAGLLFLRLFFLAISALFPLQEPIPVYAGPRVWGHTILVFGAIFLVVSVASLRAVVMKNPVQLLRARRQPKAYPTFSRWQAALGLTLCLGGYAWAAVPRPMVVIVGVVPVTVMVTVGTYLLMRAGLVAALAWLRRRERIFYRPGPFLTVSHLAYKIQENYRALGTVAVTLAVILTAMGTGLSTYVVFVQAAVDNTPMAIQLVLPSESDAAAAAARVEAVLEKHGVAGLTYRKLTTRTGKLGENAVTLAPYSLYATIERPRGETLPPVKPGEAILIHPYIPPGGTRPEGPKAAELTVGEERIPLQVWDDMGGRLLNPLPADYTLVLDDSTFAALVERTPAAERLHLALWTGPGWKGRAMEQALKELGPYFFRTYFTGSGPLPFSAKLDAYLGAASALGTVLFIGLFISLVFFAAAFSQIYFRLFTEIEDDRRYFQRLGQLGMSQKELKRLALGQAAVIFSVPFVVGVVHSTFAMQALSTLMMRSVLHYGWMVAAAYLVLYGVAFAGTAQLYWRSLRPGLVLRGA
ncbi:MAG: FtsX-like permease family protein [Firmicutes bacterium]|nr:FtsX-like permease family protein [Bacillota bacterium]